MNIHVLIKVCISTHKYYKYSNLLVGSYMHTIHNNSCLTVIGVHGVRAWSNAPQLLSDDYFVGSYLCSSLAYFMMTPPPSHSQQITYETLVARQLPTNIHTYIHVCDCSVCSHNKKLFSTKLKISSSLLSEAPSYLYY